GEYLALAGTAHPQRHITVAHLERPENVVPQHPPRIHPPTPQHTTIGHATTSTPTRKTTRPPVRHPQPCRAQDPRRPQTGHPRPHLLRVSQHRRTCALAPGSAQWLIGPSGT